jgi:amino acid adenylation domain-containing protein
MRARIITDYLLESVNKYPDKIAFADINRTVSFSELYVEALKVAKSLAGLKSKRAVAVYMDKSVECVISFMGIVLSGNFYTPIDPKMPRNRVKKILQTLRPDTIIVKDKQILEGIDVDLLVYSEIQKMDGDLDYLLEISNSIIDTDILYVLFTSGSTGDPKGVIINHRAVIDYTEWVTKTFGIDERHTFGNQAPFYFDNSVLDIYQTLKTGATTWIIPEEFFSFPIQLLTFLQEKDIDTIFWVPSALCLLADYKALSKVHVNSLKKVLFAGEVMPNKQLNNWRKEYKQALFANLYGPTEITVDCTYYIVNREFNDDEPLPIGRARENLDVLVLDGDRVIKKTDVGKKGELCVRGSALSMGYYGNSEKTDNAFVQNPLQNEYCEMIYKTGDIVEYNVYGELVYVGRKDHQIKRMGHRIELGEIESTIRAMDEVDNVCCVFIKKKERIIAFYTGGNTTEEQLKEFAKHELPSYMLPNRYIHLDNMPLNDNGKIDRIKLMEMGG